MKRFICGLLFCIASVQAQGLNAVQAQGLNAVQAQGLNAVQAQKLNWIDLPVVAPVVNDFEQLYQAKKARLQVETTQKQLVRLTLSETPWYDKNPTVLVSEACKMVRELQTLKELAGRSKYEIEFARTLSKKVRGMYRVSLTPLECRR